MSNQKNLEPSYWNPELISHPLVGHFRRRSLGDWNAHTTVRGVDYPVRITAEGTEPCQAQMDMFAELIARLPEIIASSNLPDAPTDEWRKKHPDYRLLNAQISSLILYENGSFFMSLRAYPEDDWVPMFDISPDFKVTLAEWGV
ncbi:MAG: hypothetical protein V4495_27610 [Pseudomonadota bacterium]